jgi:hypothetical protein
MQALMVHFQCHNGNFPQGVLCLNAYGNNLILNTLNDDSFYINNLIMKTFALFFLKTMHSLSIMDF